MDPVTKTSRLLTFDVRAAPEHIQVDLDQLIRSRLLIQANSGGGKSRALRYMLEQIVRLLGRASMRRATLALLLAACGSSLAPAPRADAGSDARVPFADASTVDAVPPPDAYAPDATRCGLPGLYCNADDIGIYCDPCCTGGPLGPTCTGGGTCMQQGDNLRCAPCEANCGCGNLGYACCAFGGGWCDVGYQCDLATWRCMP